VLESAVEVFFVLETRIDSWSIYGKRPMAVDYKSEYGDKTTRHAMLCVSNIQ